MLVLDLRHVSRQVCFDWTREGLVAYLATVDPRFGNVADEVARRTTPLQLADLRWTMRRGRPISCSTQSLWAVSRADSLRLIMELLHAECDSGAAVHVCPSWYGFSPLCASATQLSLGSAGGDVLHHLWSKPRVTRIEVS